jgi:hypothetical protein
MDWADESAEKAIDTLRISRRTNAVEFLAATLRLAHAEGVKQGMLEAFAIDLKTFDKIFGSAP